MDNLVYRRQFIFINEEKSGFEKWKDDIILIQNTRWHLYYHPDLNSLKGNNNFFELLILGYLLDPENPTYDNKAILNDLLKNTSFELLLNKIDKYNGRFVLICHDDKNLRIVNDAVGFREVYYTFHNKIFACGSTPNIISENLHIQKTKDPDILSFYYSNEFIKTDNTWVGNKTLYEGIYQLLPNTYLDVFSARIVRFWPNEPLNKIPVDQCAKECAEILKGTLSSAIGRYSLHMGITSGWDTRLLLAASQKHINDIYYYINKPASFSEKNKDLVIAKRLAKKLNFNLNIIDLPNHVDEEFRNIFFKNNVLARDYLLPVFYNVFRNNWDETYTVSGSMGNGLARIYMRIPNNIEVTGKNISVFPGYNRLKYAVESLDRWAHEVKILCNKFNIDIMDLYQMEQDNSHWASLASSEQDIVREEIRPFNNRRLIQLFWSLENKYRYQYYPVIYTRIMQILWKDVMKIPINPSSKSNLNKILRILGTEKRIYRYYKRRKFLKTMYRQ